MKPISPDRLTAALEKLTPEAPTSCLNQVFVKDNNRCWLIPVLDIYLLESEGNYTRLYFGKERPLIPRSLSALQGKLDQQYFSVPIGGTSSISKQCRLSSKASEMAYLLALRAGEKWNCLDAGLFSSGNSSAFNVLSWLQIVSILLSLRSTRYGSSRTIGRITERKNT